MYGRNKGFRYARIWSPDFDVFFILLHYAIQLPGIVIVFVTGTGNKRRCIIVSTIADEYIQQYCSALMALHAFTGCDRTSAFKGIGKVKPVKLIQKKPRFERGFSRLGDDWDVNEELFGQLEEFTYAMYGKPRLGSVREMRHCPMKEKCGLDGGNTLNPSKNLYISTLPTCQN